MKARKTVVFALAAGLGMAGASAFAQTQTQAPQPAPAPTTEQAPGGPGPGWGNGMGYEMGYGMGYGMGRDRGPRMSKEDRAAFFDARIAAVHAGLRLTPEQEKLWPPVETAVRNMVKTMSEAYDKRRAAGAPKDPMEGMRNAADMQIARGEAMKKIADAASPLYATLTPEQKARLPQLAHHHGMRERVGGWMREHGMRWGWGRDRDDDRPRNWRRDDDDGPRGWRRDDDRR